MSSYINYIEPNYNDIHITNNMEDYCIAVQIEVSIPDKAYSGSVQSHGKKVIIGWLPSEGSNVTNIMGGHNFGTKENPKNYLTTGYTNPTYDGIKNSETSEMFGISSINIKYDNYYFPTIDIEFVDIRGAALFGPSEENLRDNTMIDISSTFFTSFFSLPKPLYIITVKGFYGKPITYEMDNVDFRASFDSQNGNFNASAKFIARNFSILTDAIFSPLIAAPLSPNGGIEYWQSKVADGTFTCDDGRELPTFTELIDRYKAVGPKVEESVKDGTLYAKLKTIEQDISNYNYCRELIINYFNDLSYNNYYAYNDNTVIRYKCVTVNRKNDTKSFENINENVVKLTNNNGIKYLCHKLCTIKKDNITNRVDVTIDNSLRKNSEFGDIAYNIFQQNKNKFTHDNTEYYIHIYSADEALNNIDKTLANKKSEYNRINTELNNEIDKNIIDVVGIVPNAYNICKIAIAHLETLVYLLKQCGDTIKNNGRGVEIFKPEYKNIQITDIQDNLNNGFLPPFFDVVVNDKYEWIGNITQTSDVEEIKLIDGLLKGIEKHEDIATKINENVEQYNENDNIGNEYLIIPSDFIRKSKIFETSNNVDTDSLISMVGMRGVLVSSIIGKNKNEIYNCGWLDYQNFQNQFGDKDVFIGRVYNTMTGNDFIEHLKNNKYITVNSNINRTDCEIKYQNIGINNCVQGKYDEFNSLCNYISEDKYYKLYTDGDSIVEVENNTKIYNKYLLIDLDYNKYESLVNSYNETKPIESIKNLKYSQDRFKKYFGDTIDAFIYRQPSFRQKFSYGNNDAIIIGKNAEYEPIKNSNIFPPNGNLDALRSENVFNYETTHYKIEKLKINKKDTDKNEKRVPFNIIDVFNHDISDLEQYTLYNFLGYKNGKLSWERSLFCQQEYYNLGDTIENRACMFLSNFRHFYKMDEIESCFRDVNDEERELYNIMPYLGLIILGASIWLYDNKYDYIKKFCGMPKYGINFRKDVKNVLTKVFLEWVKNQYKQIDSEFSLKFNNNGNIDDLINILKRSVQTNIISGLKDCFNSDNSFYRAYCSYAIKQDDDKNYLLLLNNESNVLIDELVKTMFKPCAVIQTKFVSKDNLGHKDNVIKYLDGFIDALKESYDNKQKLVQQSNGNANSENINEQNKLVLYNYLKILYDKWIGYGIHSVNSDMWDVKGYFEKHFHFIDTFYNYRNDIWVDLKELTNILIHNYSVSGFSLFNFLGTVCSGNNMQLCFLQNFLSYNDTSDNGAMMNLFKPIPYIQCDMNESHYTDVVVMTKGKRAKSDKDSLYLTNKNEVDLPTPIKIKDLRKPPKDRGDDNTLKVPCFGVSYGMQYQSVFKDIEVSMDNPVPTETSINNYISILRRNGDDNKLPDNGADKNVYIGSNGLYSVYSEYSYTCTLTMMGNAWIQPLMYFTLLNVPMFRGSYIVQSVSHSITNGDMKTTVLGVRMSKTDMPINNNTTMSKSDSLDYSYNDSSLTPKNQYADIDNNCPYKIFYPSNNFNIDIDINMLKTTTVNDYIGNDDGWDDDFKTDYGNDTMWDSLVSLLWGEYGNGTDLDQQLIATTLFNRIMKSDTIKNGLKKNVCKYMQYNGLTFNNDILANDSVNSRKQYNNGERWNKCSANLQYIFENTPSVLVGTSTKPKKSVNIYVNGEKTDETTGEHIITIDDVQSMWFYVNADWYQNGKQNAKEHWKYIYQLHHNDHLFTTAEQYKNCWNSEKSKKESTSIEVQKYMDFVECIIKTCKHTPSIGIENVYIANTYEDAIKDTSGIYLTTIELDDSNSSILNGDKKLPLNGVEQHFKLFDVILNAYANQCSIIQCVYRDNNDIKGNPMAIRVILGDNAKKNIGVVIPTVTNNYVTHTYIGEQISKDNNGNYQTLLNDKFYTSLGKYFDGNISNEDKGKFSDFMNFKQNDMDNVNAIIKNKIKSCDSVIPTSSCDIC